MGDFWKNSKVAPEPFPLWELKACKFFDWISLGELGADKE
jgi:hypothetical protein